MIENGDDRDAEGILRPEDAGVCLRIVVEFMAIAFVAAIVICGVL
jgi:hypothetical protein